MKADDLLPYLPPAFGALLGLRYAKDQTPAQKLTSFVFGFGLGVWFGPAIAEGLSLGPRLTIAAGILVAVLGMDVIGGLMAALSQFKADPLGTGRRWINAWFGRADQ